MIINMIIKTYVGGLLGSIALSFHSGLIVKGLRTKGKRLLHVIMKVNLS